MRKLLPILLFAAAIVLGSESPAYAGKQNETAIRKAYSFRKDIDATVLKTAKAWKKTGIIHSDWIENRSGRSIDLLGNEMFPHIEYSALSRFCDSLFVITVKSGAKGVITRSGRYLIPPLYGSFDFSQMENGVILACPADGGARRVAFSSLGAQLCSMQSPEGLTVRYLPAENLIWIYFKEGGYTNLGYLFYPDGTLACTEPSLYGGKLFLKEFSHTVEHTADGATRTFALNNGIHPSVQVSEYFTDYLDGRNFLNNHWIKEFVRYEGEKNYAKAQFCLDYYKTFERDELISLKSIANYLQFAYGVFLLDDMGKYKDVIAAVENRDSGNPLPFDLSFKLGSGLSFGRTMTRSEKQKGLIDNIVAGLNDVYKSSLHKREQQRILNEQRAAAFAVAFGAVALGTAAALAAPSSGTSVSGGSAYTAPSAGYHAAPSSGSSSSSEPRTELQTVEKHETCPTCKGGGVYLNGPDMGKRCKPCDGKGYRVRYENVRVNK